MSKLVLTVFLSVFMGCATSRKASPVVIEQYKAPAAGSGYRVQPIEKPIKVSVETAQGVFRLREAYEALKQKAADLEFMLRGCKFKASSGDE